MSTPTLDNNSGTPTPAAGGDGWWSRQTTTAPVALAAAVALALLVAVIVAFPRSSTPETTQPATITEDRVADGCLGGDGNLNDALKTAQLNAPLTGVGAAEFLATLTRWGAAATPQDEAALGPSIATAEWLPSVPKSDPPEAGTTKTVKPKVYRIAEASRTDARVDILTDDTVVRAGQAPESSESWGSFPLSAVDGVWRVAGPSTATEYTYLIENGTAFRDPC